MNAQAHQPVRMCVACRSRRPAATLLRLRRRSDGQVVSARRNSVGRSAYLCPTRSCYDKAISRRAFSRSLGGPKGLSVAADGSTLWAEIEQDVATQVQLLRRTGAAKGSRRLNELVSLGMTELHETTQGVPHGQGSRL